jgi:hypothetical protein
MINLIGSDGERTLEPAWTVILTLVHHGFQGDDFAHKMMGQGWRSKGPAIDSAEEVIFWSADF